MSQTVTKKKLLKAQKNEITEHYIYRSLAHRMKNEQNRQLLNKIAEDEKRHYEAFGKLTGKEAKPSQGRIVRYKILSRVLGLSFTLRLMERGEQVTQKVYQEFRSELPELADIVLDEQKHEAELLDLIEDENIIYASSIVLGLNDALVELTGALAGLTFALQDSNVIAMAGFITGMAASMSMAASEFLSSREETDGGTSNKKPLKSATYTGITYLVTVLVLILPYLLFISVYVALGVMLTFSVLIILGYNFYIATAKGKRLWYRFAEMTAISLGVAAVSFLVGIAARKLFGVEV